MADHIPLPETQYKNQVDMPVIPFLASQDKCLISLKDRKNTADLLDRPGGEVAAWHCLVAAALRPVGHLEEDGADARVVRGCHGAEPAARRHVEALVV